MHSGELTRDSILRVGEVVSVQGRQISIKVDKNNNLSDIFLDGKILRNIAVNNYIEIRKGFLSIIGKVDGEKIEEEPIIPSREGYHEVDRNKRYLTVSLVGYIDLDDKFVAGTKELPLIGNEAYVVTKEKFLIIHSLLDGNELSINIAKTDEDFDIAFPIDGLFNGHIAIFGNTGSGKSNTLACLYQEFVKTLYQKNPRGYKSNTKFILFDFNGEYGDDCITEDKRIFRLSTRHLGDKIPFNESELLDLELLSILSDATEKTQKPFLKRTLSLCAAINNADDSDRYLQKIIQERIKNILQMSDKIKAFLLLDYMKEIFVQDNLTDDIEWHNTVHEFRRKIIINNTVNWEYLSQNPAHIQYTKIYQNVEHFEFPSDVLEYFITLLYIQLIADVLANRAQNEHIVPVINRLKSRKDDINKIFGSSSKNEDLWKYSNFIVINLNDVNLEMKKTIPLLLCKKIYSEHKQEGGGKSLNVIIDEAHMILSRESFRETESWKDYRLETFEEMIKEGRKFGVFITISSQRPNDISPTITSQAHNYFIHRLVNQRDLDTISSAVSYIDKITEDSIPTLPTGTCVFSGVTSKRPLKVHIKELEDRYKPQSQTLKFADLISKNDSIF